MLGSLWIPKAETSDISDGLCLIHLFKVTQDTDEENRMQISSGSSQTLNFFS